MGLPRRRADAGRRGGADGVGYGRTVRASRLVSLLLLLQARGRMTAAELADALEVSVRTVYRDVESLGAAGVPVYAERGPAGGYRLLDGYRTRLTGLTAGEAEALFLAGVPGPAAELGLGSVLATAELKLRAALPADLADPGGRIRQRFHLDAPSWFREPEPTPHLAALATSVWEDRRVRVRYRRWQVPREVTRILDPLGVVLKAGRWYLVAAASGQVRTYRVGAILELTVLDEPAERPTGFDLAACWQEHAERYERGVYRAEARVRMTVAALARTTHLLPPAMSRAAQDHAGGPDADGWVTTTVPIESVRHGCVEMLKLGAQVEVLAPPELRERLASTAHALAALYPPPAAAPTPGDASAGEPTPGDAPTAGTSGRVPAVEAVAVRR
ncbi:helix-turn-helix transcriptional regulator [Micromonospora sp. NBC_00617]|uniref:helix-turn-helix transcriptional regulator n=1 Tax=Micromonospora sp. NBC_00617 TaxID=2903587 RepID=UPI0030E3BFE8